MGRGSGTARLLMIGGIALGLGVCSVLVRTDAPARAGSPSTLDLSNGATATARAVRGNQIRIRPVAHDCQRVAVIGDSLTDNARGPLQRALDAADLTSVIDAQPSRRIPATAPKGNSGVLAARRVRATWSEADCWVIALGSNDLIFGGGDSDVAAGLIESMLATVTPDSTVWWVNLAYHLDPTTRFDFVGATARFNDQLVLAERAGKLTVIDWYSLAEAHRDWFFDPVHVNIYGASQARAQQIVDAITN